VNARGSFDWNDETVAKLKRLHAEGLSASIIAAQLGGISRSGVLGKIHRLGLSSAGRTPSPLVPRQRSRGERSGLLAARLAVRRQVKAGSVTASPPAQQRREDAPPPLNVRLVDLNDSHCRWPVSAAAGPETLYCGLAHAPDSSWCAYHGGIGYGRGTPSERRALETLKTSAA
jgi:GcrA cell cycle regulator